MSGFAAEFTGYVWTEAVPGKKSCGFKNIRIVEDVASSNVVPLFDQQHHCRFAGAS